jgi:hypothetical protein
MKKNYENPTFELQVIEVIETSDNNLSNVTGFEDEIPGQGII